VTTESSTTARTDGLPADLLTALARIGVAADRLVEQPQTRPRPVRRLVGAGLVVDLARDGVGRHHNAQEAFGRRWATDHGLPTATLHAVGAGHSWLLGEYLVAGQPTGPDYVAQALEIADRLALLPAPTGGPAPTLWRAPRRTLAIRMARLVAAGLPVRTWYTARAMALALPPAVTAHGDYYFRNVLWTGPTRGVRLVDWEYLGRAPRHADALRLWSCLKDPDDRNLLVETLLRNAPQPEHRQIGLQAHWLGLRLFAENLSAPRSHRNTADARHARLMVDEGRRLAQDLGAWPPG
jgi:hypothetical protein